MEELRDCGPLSRALRWLRLTARALNREGQAVVWEEGALQPPPPAQPRKAKWRSG